jgi:hypothetical protein
MAVGVRVGRARRLGTPAPLGVIARDPRRRLTSIFLGGPRRPASCFGWIDRLEHEPRLAGQLVVQRVLQRRRLEAAHQTGWTGLVADVIRRQHQPIVVPTLDAVRSMAENATS